MSESLQPLADRLRPRSFDDVVGQDKVVSLIKRVLERNFIPNMIFFGPPGTGKTTVSNIIAAHTNRRLYKLNATTASISDIRDIISGLDTLMSPQGALLYLDEIQYFNKKQQQSLLEFIENGKITLIASTTENPYFSVYAAILSRATVFEFKPVNHQDSKRAVRRALQECGCGNLPDSVANTICDASGGDLRKAMNAIELLTASGSFEPDDVALVCGRSAVRHDRDGDSHYDLMSAMQKSIRGSDPDAAVYYLARLLSGGDLTAACRRLLVTASEDIGLAYPQAVSIVKACVDNALKLGMPEAALPLAQAAILLATAPKSNSAASAIGAALADIEAGLYGEVPDHLRDGHYDGAAKLGRAIGYKYPHDYPDNWVQQDYLPEKLRAKTYYNPGSNKNESTARAYWDKITGKALV